MPDTRHQPTSTLPGQRADARLSPAAADAPWRRDRLVVEHLGAGDAQAFCFCSGSFCWPDPTPPTVP